MHKLYRDLLRDYVKDVRPSEVHSQPLVVEFGFSLAQIIDVVCVASKNIGST